MITIKYIDLPCILHTLRFSGWITTLLQPFKLMIDKTSLVCLINIFLTALKGIPL